jgi:hypothetical protein
MKKSKKNNRITIGFLWSFIIISVIAAPIFIINLTRPYTLNLPQDNNEEIPVSNTILLPVSGVTFRNYEYFELQNTETQEIIQPEFVSKSADVSQPFFVIGQVPAGNYRIVSARLFTYPTSEKSIIVTVMQSGIEKAMVIFTIVAIALIIILSSISGIIIRR